MQQLVLLILCVMNGPVIDWSCNHPIWHEKPENAFFNLKLDIGYKVMTVLFPRLHQIFLLWLTTCARTIVNFLLWWGDFCFCIFFLPKQCRISSPVPETVCYHLIHSLFMVKLGLINLSRFFEKLHILYHYYDIFSLT